MKDKKKILFLGRFAPPMHGAARMNELYFNSLKKDRDFDVKKIKLNKYEHLEDIGKINFNQLKFFFKTMGELINKIRIFNPEIIYIEMAPKGAAFFRDSIYILISKIFRKKIFIQFHAKGAKETTKSRIAQLYYKFIFKQTQIILLSEILFKDISNVARENQIEILPNRIPDEITDKEFEQILKEREKNKKPILLFLSNMIESKGPIDVLRICNKLDKEGIDFECNFVGKFQNENFKEKFESKIKEFNLQEKCKYLGAKYGKEKNKILEKTNYLIFPTRYPEETFGLVILEAFMFGIPVLSYDTGSISEIISKKNLGFVSKNQRWEELEKVLKKRLLKKENATKIREHFKKNYLLNISKQKLKRILK